MTYSQYNIIEASDFNTLAGNSTSEATVSVNKIWSTGMGSSGYGQTQLTQETIGNSITANNWASLTTTTTKIGRHQGTSLGGYTVPYKGLPVEYYPELIINIQNVNTNKLNAAKQGTTSTSNVTFGKVWSNSLVFTYNVTFTSGDAARYFFNAGGQLVISCSHTTGSGINSAFYDITKDLGNIIISSPSYGSCKIIDTQYTGVTQISAGPSAPAILDVNAGYYGLSTANTVIATQYSQNLPLKYVKSNIQVIAKTNGTQGQNGDNGSIITLYTIWTSVTDIPEIINATSTTSCHVRYPYGLYIANTWGTGSKTGWATGT